MRKRPTASPRSDGPIRPCRGRRRRRRQRTAALDNRRAGALAGSRGGRPGPVHPLSRPGSPTPETDVWAPKSASSKDIGPDVTCRGLRLNSVGRDPVASRSGPRRTPVKRKRKATYLPPFVASGNTQLPYLSPLPLLASRIHFLGKEGSGSLYREFLLIIIIVYLQLR